MMSMLEDVVEYVMSKAPMFNDNRWFHDSKMSVYIRRSQRVLHGEWVLTLEIANVDVRMKHQNQKMFTTFLERLEDLNSGRHIYVENVLDRRFQEFFEKRHYLVMHDDGLTRSYIQNKS